MKKFLSLLGLTMACGAFVFAGCDSDSGSNADEESSSSTASSSFDYDCTISKGTKVFYPEGGETFKMGDSVKVIFSVAPDAEDGSYRFAYVSRVDGKLKEIDLTSESINAKNFSLDGTTCNEMTVLLDGDKIAASDSAVIRVIPYNLTNKLSSSGVIKVVE